MTVPPSNPDHTIRVLDHGFVRLDDAMADDLSVVNGARVSFARRKEEMDDSDAGLIRFLMRDRHGSPFEHNAFRFHIRCPIFVAREWFRHRIGAAGHADHVRRHNGTRTCARRSTTCTSGKSVNATATRARARATRRRESPAPPAT